jgi:hypothetical protein
MEYPEWVIETKIPIFSDELIASARTYLTIRDSRWAYTSDEEVIGELIRLGVMDQLMREFDKALCKALEPAPLSMYDDFFDRYLRPIDWHAIGVRVGKLYLDSKRRHISDDTTK